MPSALNNPPPSLQRSGSSQSSSPGQYPVHVSRGQDIRPHVYTELKTFAPGLHVRPPSGASGGGCGGVDPLLPPGGAACPTGTSCTASLPRYRHTPATGTHTTTTFGSAPNGAQTITTFGTPRPLCSDGMESGSLHSDSASPTKAESCQNTQTLECRPLAMRAANVRIPEPPKPPAASQVQETNLDVAADQHSPQPQLTPADSAHNGSDVTSEVNRDVTDGDTSQDSGVVDAQELCQSIDDAFFKGMVIKQKTLV